MSAIPTEAALQSLCDANKDAFQTKLREEVSKLQTSSNYWKPLAFQIEIDGNLLDVIYELFQYQSDCEGYNYAVYDISLGDIKAKLVIW